MRRTALIGVSLTLLMLLLVLSSAFVFLFQGRQQLQLENESVSSSLAQTQQELDITYDTLDASGRELATAQATNLLLEGQLVDSQQEVDSATTILETREAEVAQVTSERNQFLSQPPVIEIISPAEDEPLIVGDTVEYDLFIADSVGVTAVLVSINEEQIDAFSLTGNLSERLTGEWIPSEVGEVVLGVQASNSRTSVLVTRTLAIEAPIGQTVPLGEAPFRAERLAVETAVQNIRQLQPTDSDITVNFQTNQEQRQGHVPLIASLSVTESLTVWSLFDLETNDFFLPQTGVSFRYDPQEDALNINGLGIMFDPIDAYDYAGAYTALLLDQNFTAVDSAFLPLDAQLALQALIIGDSSESQALLMAADFFPPDEAVGLDDALQSRQHAPLELLLLQAGQAFANYFGPDDRLIALNNAWQSPPSSTEQLFHPATYLAQETAVTVTLLNLTETLGEGWEPWVNETAGELVLRLYLSQYLNELQVETAVTGWGGDRFAVYQNDEEDEYVLIIKMAWDTIVDSNEFAALYPNYPTRLYTAAGVLNDLGECWRGEDVICLFQDGLETAVVRAPTLELALAAGEALFE